MTRSEDKRKMQKDKWVEESLMEFTDENSEQISHGVITLTMETLYKGPTRKDCEKRC